MKSDNLHMGVATLPEPSEDVPAKLLGEFDGSLWASEFISIAVDFKKEEILNQHWLTSWFANAIMTGFDNGKAPVKKEDVKKAESNFELAIRTFRELCASHQNDSVRLDAASQLIELECFITGNKLTGRVKKKK